MIAFYKELSHSESDRTALDQKESSHSGVARNASSRTPACSGTSHTESHDRQVFVVHGDTHLMTELFHRLGGKYHSYIKHDLTHKAIKGWRIPLSRYDEFLDFILPRATRIAKEVYSE